MQHLQVFDFAGSYSRQVKEEENAGRGQVVQSKDWTGLTRLVQQTAFGAMMGERSQQQAIPINKHPQDGPFHG